MNILGFLILHTGRPYLRAAIESLIDQVDHIVILYTRTPSQGFQADIPCPDSHDDLLCEFTLPALQGKATIEWVEGKWANESDHINAIWPYAAGYDWVWRFDADEVSPPGMVAEMISQAKGTMGDKFRVPFVHFWRSFSWACRDGSHPFRLFRLNGGYAEQTLDSKGEKWEVLHFGYAQPTPYIEYKMLVSGHRPEWRPNWFAERWLANAKEDVHPVMYPTHWMAKPYDKTTLPQVLRRHRYYGAEVIE